MLNNSVDDAERYSENPSLPPALFQPLAYDLILSVDKCSLLPLEVAFLLLFWKMPCFYN